MKRCVLSFLGWGLVFVYWVTDIYAQPSVANTPQPSSALLAPSDFKERSLVAKNDSKKKKSSKQKKDKKKKKKKDKLRWEGNLKFAFRIARNRSRNAENQAGLELSAINLKVRYRLQKGLQLRAWYQVDPIESELKEAFARYNDDNAIFDRIQMGLQRRLFALPSDLETDNLNKIALYKLRDLGIFTRITFLERWYWAVELANGGQLDTRDISPRRVTKQDVILSDSFDDRQAVGTSSREIVMGFGYDRELPSAFKRLHFLLFFSGRPVNDSDTTDLATLSDVPGFTGVNTGTTSYTKVGFNAIFEYGQWRSYSQYATTRIRDLDRHLFGTELIYRWGKWRPMLAYSTQTLSVDPEFDAPLSWRRRRLTLGSRYQWLDSTRLAFELTLNDEDTGGDTVNNDEALVAWIYSF